MRFISVFIGILCYSLASGQYYYNDILATQQSQQQYQLLRTNKVKKMQAISYEEDRTPTEGFKLEQELTIDGKKWITRTANISGKTSETTSFFELGKLKRTQSYSNGIENKMEYGYDEKGQIKFFTLTTMDTAMNYTSVETREWHYNVDGHITDVLKIKNRSDSSLASFVYDENGNLVEEHWKKKNREIETYYYYYNNAKQLTDIVRYNNRLKKLIPDYQYEYDEKGKPTQMTQLAANGKYYIWKYGYNEKGLKISEKCIDNKKNIIGSIEYKYDN
jgi:antitoxin component YwqK of YwqJK toxin-antitoxin module